MLAGASPIPWPGRTVTPGARRDPWARRLSSRPFVLFALCGIGVGGTRDRPSWSFLLPLPSLSSSRPIPRVGFLAPAGFLCSPFAHSSAGYPVQPRPLAAAGSPFFRKSLLFPPWAPQSRHQHHHLPLRQGEGPTGHSSSSAAAAASAAVAAAAAGSSAGRGLRMSGRSADDDAAASSGKGSVGTDPQSDNPGSAGAEGAGDPTTRGGGGGTGGGGGGGGDFPAVTLDADATQKFAEIEVEWGDGGVSEPTVLIRGLESAAYHVEAAEPTMERLRQAGAKATITGGGRIKHSSNGRSISIYGYSMQFGPANLARVADLCRKQYPSDYEVTWTEGGY